MDIIRPIIFVYQKIGTIVNKLFKANTLALCLLATSGQIILGDTPNNPPSYWQIAITFFFGNQEQPHNDSNQAPAGITAQDYINQLRSDLNGSTNHNRLPVIPWTEVSEIEQTLKEELRFVDLRNSDMVNNKIYSVLADHVKTKTVTDLNELAQEGFWITAQDYQIIPNSNECNMFARLERMPHLNGEAIAQYFGEHRKNSTRQSVINRNNNRNPFDPSGGAHQ